MEEVLPVLKRIADALDEQNRQYAEWIEMHRERYQQSDPLKAKIVAIHEENAALQQTWRDLNTRALQTFLEEQRQIIEKGLKKETQTDHEPYPFCCAIHHPLPGSEE